MKKLFYLLLLFLVVTFSSCSEDPIPEQPPTAVTNIDAEVVEETNVKITWNASEDPNGDPVHYQVIVNDVVASESTTETFVVFDVEQFLTEKPDTFLELNIKIKAIDSKNQGTDFVEKLEKVFVNRIPSDFEIKEVLYYRYRFWLSWSPSNNPDEDLVRYNIYINDVLIEENFLPDYKDDEGNLIYYKYDDLDDYERIFSNDTTEIRIVAIDAARGKREKSYIYKSKLTDVELGTLTLPYKKNFRLVVTSKELDNKVGYKFTINKKAKFSLSRDYWDEYDFKVTLKAVDGSIITLSNSYNYYDFYKEYASLPPGEYYIELHASYVDNSLEFDLELIEE